MAKRGFLVLGLNMDAYPVGYASVLRHVARLPSTIVGPDQGIRPMYCMVHLVSLDTVGNPTTNGYIKRAQVRLGWQDSWLTARNSGLIAECRDPDVPTDVAKAFLRTGIFRQELVRTEPIFTPYLQLRLTFVKSSAQYKLQFYVKLVYQLITRASAADRFLGVS